MGRGPLIRMALAIVQFTMIYLAIGVVVGVAFLFLGIDRVDPAARGSYAFRPLLLPGLALLWPFVGVRWFVLARRGS
jgi:hypothetical protein